MRKLTLTGYIGKDAEVKFAPNGDQFAVFTVATNVSDDKTLWTDITTDNLALVPYLKKGCSVLIEGHPKVNAWVKSDGKPTGSLVCNAKIIELLGKKPSNEETPPAEETEVIPE